MNNSFENTPRKEKNSIMAIHELNHNAKTEDVARYDQSISIHPTNKGVSSRRIDISILREIASFMIMSKWPHGPFNPATDFEYKLVLSKTGRESIPKESSQVEILKAFIVPLEPKIIGRSFENHPCRSLTKVN